MQLLTKQTLPCAGFIYNKPDHVLVSLFPAEDRAETK